MPPSMWSASREIAAGDLVIVWMTRDSIQSLVVSPGKDFNSKYGNYRQADFVGVPYGSKVGSRTGKGFVYLLRPTPELWTLALPHRTQILYLADIAFITSRLDIKRGSKVIEAGTGSASFSHSLARTIGTTGHLWSYEFHEARATKAREEFERHGMTDIVTLTHRNVCKSGFTVENTADSVFLDLPAPWDAIEHAKKALRKDRIARICCFSPCMEQVLRTVTALNDAGFTDITMYETLLRPHEVQTIPTPTPISQISEKLKEAEKKREEKRLRQIANNKAAARLDESSPSVTTGMKRKNVTSTNTITTTPPSSSSPIPKRIKMEQTTTTTTTIASEDVDMDMDNVGIQTSTPTPIPTPTPISLSQIQSKLQSQSQSQSPSEAQSQPPESRISVNNALPDVRGHTSYLTFAILIPHNPRIDTTTTTTTTTTTPTPTPTPTPAEIPPAVLLESSSSSITVETSTGSGSNFSGEPKLESTITTTTSATTTAGTTATTATLAPAPAPASTSEPLFLP